MGRRVALGILIALVMLGPVPGSAAAEGPTVEVNPAGSVVDPVEVPLLQLEPDVTQGAGGPGYSMYSVLSWADQKKGGQYKWLNPNETFGFKVNLPSSGDFVILSLSETIEGSRPFFRRDGTGVTVVLPNGDEKQYPKGMVTLEAIEALKNVEIVPKPENPKRGETVTFFAQVSGSGTYDYSWDFGDGSPTKVTSELQSRHRYGKTGEWKVTLVAEDRDTGKMGEASKTITVGKKKPKPEPTSDGPRQKGTGNDGAIGSPSMIGPSGGGGYGSGFGGFPGTGSIGTPDSAPPPAEAGDRPAEVNPEGLEQVSGVVIDPAASASAAAPEAGGAEEEYPVDDGAFGLSGEAATLLGVGLLIALGGLIETRILSRRL